MGELTGRGGARFLGAVVALALAACLALVAHVQPAQADEGQLAAAGTNLAEQAKPVLHTSTLWAGANTYTSPFIENMPSKAKVTKVTSSNPSVLKVTRESMSQYGYLLSPGKAGKATVKVTYKTGGKKGVLSGVYTVKAYPKPFKSLSLSGKAIPVPSPKNTDSYYAATGFTGSKATVRFALAKGWKVEYLSGYATSSSGADKNFKVKNGKAFSIPKGMDAMVSFSLVNAAGDSYFYTIDISRSAPLEIEATTEWLGDPSAYLQVTARNGDDIDRAKVTKVTSSNTSVLKVRKNGSKTSGISLDLRKPGKSTIAMTYKLDGTTYTAKAVYTVKNYPNPLASLLVNGSKVKLSSNKFGYSVNGYKKSSATVKVTPSAGWSVDAMRCYSGKYSSSGESKQIRNGAKVSVPAKGYCSVSVSLKSKAGDSFWYYVYLDRG